MTPRVPESKRRVGVFGREESRLDGARVGEIDDQLITRSRPGMSRIQIEHMKRWPAEA